MTTKEVSKNGQASSRKTPRKSSALHDALLPDILAEALARVVADKQREWQKDVERRDAEARAAVASLENRVLQLEAELRQVHTERLAEFAGKISALQGPPGANGRDGERGDVGEKGERGEPGECGPAGECGPPGADADEDKIADTVAARVLALIPQLRGERGEPGPQGSQGEPGTPGRNGVGVTEALIDRKGQLVLTWEDGSTRPVGIVVGKDGKDGAPGENGQDGIGFEDIAFEYDGERKLSLRGKRGDLMRVVDINMPIPIDRGVFKENSSYAKGDGVTYAGSWWIAQKDAPEGKPDESNGAWRLSVKRGRDAKPPVKT